MLNRRQVTFAGLAAFAASASPAFPQSWPTKPIRFVVPLAAGGGVDMMARILAERLGEVLNQRIVVENQGGAGGTIAAAAVARSDPDGYTFIFQSVSSAVINALVYKNLSYDPVGGFAPVTLFSRFPLVAAISPQLPAKDLKEFIALLKANPGKYNYGSSGVGTVTHVAGELFKSLAGVDIVHVPYRGNSAVLTDLLAGQVSLTFDGIAPLLPHIRDGRLRALGVTTAERNKVLPDVPAMKEVIPGYELPFWTGLYAPAKTPKAVIDRIAAETAKIVKLPEVVGRLEKLGVDGVGMPAAEFDAFWRQQLDYYGKIVKANNITIGQ
jgi:tripartite-type tricarboxylate transporter receptor subunit TctC